MSYNNKKFLDANGVTQIVGLLDDYATNDTLSTVVNSVQTALDQKVSDVQINGSSVLNNGIANVPMAEQGGNPGAVKLVGTSYGLKILNGNLVVNAAGLNDTKAGTSNYCPVIPSHQHESAFYGLAKLVGADMAQSSNAVGTYTDAAKQGIQKLFGFEDILGNYESSTTASRAYTVGETFIFNGKRYRATADIAQNYVITPGINCELCPIDGHYVRDTDIATVDKAGVLKVRYSSDGLFVDNNGRLCISGATDAQLKNGSNNYRTITTYSQHKSVFFGLAKAANADMNSLSNVTVGQYPQAQKTAIQTMLGIEADIPLIEEVSGTTPSITGMPNVRYICGTCSLLTITPPASGSIVVRFTSGSTPTVLTVPNTVKFPVWFDYTSLEADTTYEIIITDGVYGGVMSWAD